MRLRASSSLSRASSAVGPSNDAERRHAVIPYDEAMHALGGIGRTKFYNLIDNGDLERVSIDRRGFIAEEPCRIRGFAQPNR